LATRCRVFQNLQMEKRKNSNAEELNAAFLYIDCYNHPHEKVQEG
jgi:hypothetical protein